MASYRIKKEWLARTLILLLALGLPAGVILWGVKSTPSAVEVQAAMPEKGGWTPDTLKAQVGEPLTLRLTSQDVVHGFAVGKHDQPAVDILSGEVTVVTLTFDEPGKYVFYCTRWCGVNHWRMRGTIIIEGEQQSIEPAAQPLYMVMGFDLDAKPTPAVTPRSVPSVQEGQKLMTRIEESELEPYQDPIYLRTHSPARVWTQLREAPFTTGLSDEDIWHLVAALWRSGTSAKEIAAGEALYTQNCASCHGSEGDGKGVYASALDPKGEQTGLKSSEGKDTLSDTVPPADFTDRERMAAVSSAVLQGKIIRGGMGTGMPYFGPIFTEEEIWNLVDYLWAFQFTD